MSGNTDDKKRDSDDSGEPQPVVIEARPARAAPTPTSTGDHNDEKESSDG